MKHALSVTREKDFAAWYQAVVSEADMAEESGVRGCMVIRPWGYGIWERIQRLLDDQIKQAGVENCYFPLFIPLSYFAKEADHVDGFAKEMAVVTHHRLKMIDGKLAPDPAAKLEEPLIVRPTSETVIGAAMARWVQSWRDLPLMINQWANVVRWEMRTRMFLRTSEFLWQEGHTAHADQACAMKETMRAIEMYRAFAEGPMAMPVVVGEKSENERFPGAVTTWSIEAMMQDGKALQAGTSHYLGTGFAEASGIRYQDAEGTQQLAHTTSWGMSTRMIGGMIMVHGDDDGLRCPPQVAPHQIVIVPMLRDDEGDAKVLKYCLSLEKSLRSKVAFGERLRVYVDARPGKAATKRWGWVKKGAPIIIEVGPRDVTNKTVTWLRRDELYWTQKDIDSAFNSEPPQINLSAGKLKTTISSRKDVVAGLSKTLEQIQISLYTAARARLDGSIRRDITDFGALTAHYKGKDKKPGWVEVEWSAPSGEALDAIVEKLKTLQLTMRNTPKGSGGDSAPATGPCFFTGEPATQKILIGRAY
jgi:prolyl-tRNA synthetase